MKQIWFCPSCRAIGVVVLQPDIGVCDAMYRLQSAHEMARSDCDRTDVKVILPDIVDADQIVDIGIKLPAKMAPR